MNKQAVGYWLLIAGVVIEVADRFFTPPVANLSDNSMIATLQTNIVSINEGLIPIPNVHTSYLLIGVGAILAFV